MAEGHNNPDFLIDTDDEAQIDRRKNRAKTISHGAFDDSKYEYKSRRDNVADPNDLTTTASLVEHLEANKKNEVDARLLRVNKYGEISRTRNKREAFLGNWKRNNDRFNMREDAFAFDQDGYGGGGSNAGNSGNLIGNDFIPLLGGPFNKQLYLNDMLRQNALCFYAYHHDAFARAAVNITTNFTMGRGWRVDCEDPYALALWKAFEEVNDLYNQMLTAARELAAGGENMFVWLPNKETFFAAQLRPGQEPPRGVIPRVRMIDPSSCWEIITFPEDITRVVAYQIVTITQYQTYTANYAGSNVGTTKFIYQQIPADQVMHFKVNTFSNEKRGRSDLFPGLGYGKRLRDSVNYSLVSLQKQAAWSMDTTVEGDNADIQAYVQDQLSQGTIPQAGSEFVHTKAITRQFMSNAAGAKGSQEIFEWALSMYSAAVGIPVSYFGTHLSGGNTRASALVSTEPVAKHFEMRQLVYESILKKMARVLFDQFGISKDVNITVTFPEIITQDRSAKLQDLAMAEASGWISKQRAATIAAKELGITDFSYEDEQTDITTETPPIPPTLQPLTASPTVQYAVPPGTQPGSSPSQSGVVAPGANKELPPGGAALNPPAKPSAVTSGEKRRVKQNDGA